MNGPEAVKNSLIFLLLVAAAWTDISKMRIPNRLIGIGCILRIPLFLMEWEMMGKEAFIQIGEKLAGSILLLLGFSVFAVVSQYGLGFGDVKLLGVMTLYQGVEETFICLLYGLLPAAAFCLIRLASGRIHRKDKLPLAPFFLLGYLLIP